MEGALSSAQRRLARTPRFGSWNAETGKKLIVMTEVFGLSSVSCASLAWLCPPPGWTAQISCGGKSEGPRPSGPDTTALRDNGGQPESFISDVFGHKTSTGIQLWQRAGSVLPSPQLTLLVVLHSEYVVGWILHPGPVRMHEISKRVIAEFGLI